MRRRSLPPRLFPVAVSAAGALALGVGAAATISGNLWGLPLALGGLVLVGWSVRTTRRG